LQQCPLHLIFAPPSPQTGCGVEHLTEFITLSRCRASTAGIERALFKGKVLAPKISIERQASDNLNPAQCRQPAQYITPECRSFNRSLLLPTGVHSLGRGAFSSNAGGSTGNRTNC
jgi:hypothetical protein